MKRNGIIIVLFLMLSFFVFGQESENQNDQDESTVLTGTEETPVEVSAEETETSSAEEAEPEKSVPRQFKKPAWMSSEGASLDTGRRVSRRLFEVGLLDVDLSAAAGAGKVLDLITNSFNFDPAEAKGIYKIDVDIFANPLYASFPIKNLFIMDVFTGFDAKVYLEMPEETVDILRKIMDIAKANVSFTSINDMKGNLSAAAGVFAEIGVGGSKRFFDDRLQLRFAPSLFFTLVYMKKSNVSLAGYTGPDPKNFGIRGSGNMDIYSAWNLTSGSPNIFASPGLDATLEAGYALWSVLDTGVSISNIPLIPSTLKYKSSLDLNELSLHADTSDLSSLKINIPDNVEDLFKISGNASELVIRPLRVNFYGLIKPFKSPVLVVRPDLGFSVSEIFGGACFNWGLSITYNAPKIFSAYIKSSLMELIWSQYLGIMLDFRYFEMDLGAGLIGTTFADSWNGKGVGFKLGIKFGY